MVNEHPIPRADTVRRNLLLCSLYLAGYELLRVSLTDRIKDFFGCGPTWESIMDEGSLRKARARYKNALRLGGKDLSENSVRWFIGVGALTTDDEKEIQSIRKRRNKIAHELAIVQLESRPLIQIEDLRALQRLLTRVEVWWIRNIEIPTDPDRFQDYAADESLEISTGTAVLFDYLMSVASDVGDSVAQEPR